jgi:hypothetical protein
MLDRLKEEFQSANGLPASSWKDPDYSGVYWWQFEAETYLQFRIRETPPVPTSRWDLVGWIKRIFIARQIRVVIIGCRW